MAAHGCTCALKTMSWICGGKHSRILLSISRTERRPLRTPVLGTFVVLYISWRVLHLFHLFLHPCSSSSAICIAFLLVCMFRFSPSPAACDSDGQHMGRRKCKTTPTRHAGENQETQHSRRHCPTLAAPTRRKRN